MESIIPSALWSLLLEFKPMFSAPTFENFATLAIGWFLCFGRHTISRVIQFGRGIGPAKHHSTYYRFFSRAVWATDAVGAVLLRMALRYIPDPVVYLIVDDTLCHKSGPHLWGAGMHHDAPRSTYGRGSSAGRKPVFSFGHNWVIVCIWVPLPWNPNRGLALPVRWRLYRPKKRCPSPFYRKRPDLARDLLAQVLEELPADRRGIVLGDSEYSCKTVVRHLPLKARFVGRMPMDAAFFALPGSYGGRGRPRVKGIRLPSPQRLAADDTVPWQEQTVEIYGRKVTFLVKTQVGLWYRVSGQRPCRMVVTRDPTGRLDDRAYCCLDPEMSIAEIAMAFSRRWSQEVMHRNIKQYMGMEDPQNGWWRRRNGCQRKKKRPGPQPHVWRGARAAQRTISLAFVSYVLVVIWYFQVGSPELDVARVRTRAPWYRQKREPSFADMLASARRRLWIARLSANPIGMKDCKKIEAALPEWLIAA